MLDVEEGIAKVTGVHFLRPLPLTMKKKDSKISTGKIPGDISYITFLALPCLCHYEIISLK